MDFNVYQPDFGKIHANAQNAFARGRQAYQAGVARDAGESIAGGDYGGARNAFLKSGNLDAGLKIQQHIDAMDERQRAAAKRINAIVGQVA